MIYQLMSVYMKELLKLKKTYLYLLSIKMIILKFYIVSNISSSIKHFKTILKYLIYIVAWSTSNAQEHRL